MATVVIIEDEAVLARNLGKAFTRRGFVVREAGTIAEGLRAVEEARPEVVLLDLRLPDGSGIDALPKLLAADPDVAVIMMTAYGSVADAVQAMQQGARDFVLKPFDLDEIRLRVERAVGAARAQREIAYYRERETGAGAIVGDSPPMGRLRDLVARLARDGAPRRRADRPPARRDRHGQGTRRAGDPRHRRSARRAVHRGQLHRAPGAPGRSGALRPRARRLHRRERRRAGLFETADGGTIFLDEIGHVATSLQAKFLKVVEEKTVRRIGATAVRAVDVQIVAATSRDIEAAVHLGEFRDDLYQRLSVAVIRIPAAARARRGCGGAGPRASSSRRAGGTRRRAAAVARRRAGHPAHAWPGNVRELQNVMERVVLFTDSDPVTANDLGLPTAATPAPWRCTRRRRADRLPRWRALARGRRARAARRGSRAGGRQSDAGPRACSAVSRDTLRYRIEKYGLGE